MKFTAVLAVIAAATVVSASTNAERLARGLSPNAPSKRATPAFRARRGSPSGTPGQNPCNTGSVHCCNSVQKAGQGGTVDELLQLLGIAVPIGTSVGTNCSPISVIGVGSNSCTQQTVCCDDNHFNGLVNVGCSPININL